MKCPKCGKEIANDSRFCEYCGAPVSQPSSNRPIWITLAVLFVLVWLGIISILLYLENSYKVPEYSEEAVDSAVVDSVAFPEERDYTAAAKISAERRDGDAFANEETVEVVDSVSNWEESWEPIDTVVYLD